MKQLLPTFLVPFLLTAAGVRAELHFSHTRGFYDDNFKLVLKSSESAGEIKYTTDGSDPASNGMRYRGAISVDRSMCVRAVEVDLLASEDAVTTHTYILPSRVWKQPKFPDGYLFSYTSLRKGTQTFDWELDPDLLKSREQRQRLEHALSSLPALAVGVAAKEFNFIFENHSMRGPDFERPASVELIYPATPRFEGMTGFQIDCGLRMQGGLAVDQARKKSFRLLFKKKYGAGKLRYPVFESAPNGSGSAVDRFDTLVLRAGGNGNWSKDDAWKHEPGVYLRDPLVRDSQIAMSGIGAHSTFVHLFINGLYNGIYNIAERPDTKFLASYLGGDPTDFYSVNHGGTVDGNPNQWLHAISQIQTLESPAKAELVEIDAFCDYIILNWFVGMGDWPWNNYYAGMRNDPPGAIRFSAWDSEFAFWPQRGYLASNPGAWVNPNFVRPNRRSRRAPAVVAWQALERDPEFLMAFADRVSRHCYGEGALTDERMVARFDRLTDMLDLAVPAEAMRWGDAAIGREDRPHTKKQDWLPNCRKIRRMIEGNVKRFVTALRGFGYYPTLDAPTLSSLLEQRVETGLEVRLLHSNSIGSILFTKDGTDPRAPGGAVHQNARRWKLGTAIRISKPMHIKARVYAASEDGMKKWSALCEQRLFPKPAGVTLRITELMFAPPEDEALEFVEIANIGDVSVDATGYSLSGVDFKFAPGTIVEGKQVMVIIPNDDPSAFAAKYPEVSVAGHYRKHLSNEGERIAIVDSRRNVIDSVEFSPEGFDAGKIVGGGFSLERAKQGGIAGAHVWNQSARVGGTPGAVTDGFNKVSQE